MPLPAKRSRLLAPLVLAACSTPLLPDGPDPPSFPPDLPSQVTTQSGLLVQASVEVAGNAPTVLRVTASVSNPTGEDILAPTLGLPCEIIVVVSWQRSPFVRLVQPLDGGGSLGGGALGSCGRNTDTRLFPAGETVEFAKPDLVLSEVLESTFAPGRYVLSVIFVDQFIYEVLAGDLQVPD